MCRSKAAAFPCKGPGAWPAYKDDKANRRHADAPIVIDCPRLATLGDAAIMPKAGVGPQVPQVPSYLGILVPP